MNKVFNIDWLQLNTRGIMKLIDGYTYTILPYHTRVFEKITEVKKEERKICTIASNPYSSIIKKDTHLIKFDNKLLYDFDLPVIVELFLKKSSLKLISITRLDICCDFNYFDCNITGKKIIQNFHANKYYHHSKSNFCSYGRQSKVNVYDYLRFGSNTSPISVYLYNKTLEMLKKEAKQHIYNSWKHNGIDATKDVFRLEFSIKSSQVTLVNNYYGQQEKLTLSNIFSSSWLQKLFFVLVNSHFKFSLANKFKHIKELKELKLFNHLNYNYTHKIYCELKDSNRADKVFIKKMESYNNELRSIRLDLAEDMNVLKQRFIDSRNLRDFYNRKVLDI